MRKVTKHHRSLHIVLVLLAFCIISVFSSMFLQADVHAANTKTGLNQTKLTLNTGKKYTLKLSGISGKVKWTTSKKSVATVSSKGVVTAKKKGTATITARAGSKKYTCRVTVKQPVKSVKLNKKSYTLKKAGAAVTLKASVSPSSANNRSVTWKSSNTKVATVSSKGKVKAVGNGTATITATAKDGSKKKASCKITVKLPVVKAKKISLNRSSATLTSAGSSLQLTTSFSPSGTTNRNVSWKSSNTKVAAVDSKGKVTARGNGTATITAATKDGSKKTASCKITVKIPAVVKVSSVALNRTSATLTARGQTLQLAASVSPSSAANKAVTWKSSNTGIASVDSSGKVTAVANGTATVTATAKDGSGKAASCKISVSISSGSPAPAPAPSTPSTPSNVKTASGTASTSVSISGNGTGFMAGETLQLTASVTPAGATDKSITWSSSNTSVATVDSNGKVTMLAAGDCTITAYAVNWGVPAEYVSTVVKYNWSLERQAQEFQPRAAYNITVTPARTQITGIWLTDNDCDGEIAVTQKMIPVGGTKKVALTLNSAYTNPKNAQLVWTSSDPGIATVDSSGTVTGIAKGYATITVKTQYPAEDGTYPTASTTYRVGAYTYDEILNNLTIDREASLTAHEYLNHIRTTPADRALASFRDQPAVEARIWDEGLMQLATARASRNIVCTMIGGWTSGEKSDRNSLATHGGMQNGYGGSWSTSGTILGRNAARGLTEDHAHMVNQLDSRSYVAIAFVRYSNPSGVNLTSMIVDMSPCSYAEGKQNLANAGVSFLDDMEKSILVPKEQYLDFCRHFGITAG